MFSRAGADWPSEDGRAKWDHYQRKNDIDLLIIRESLRYCFRYIRRGISCALIGTHMSSVKEIIKEINSGIYFKELVIIKKTEDGFVFENDVKLRVLPKINESYATILIGKDVKVIQCKEGDSKFKKFRIIMDS